MSPPRTDGLVVVVLAQALAEDHREVMAGEKTTDREIATWSAHAYGYGRDRLHVMHDELERGDDLTIDPVAWDNTMAALDWMAGDWMARSMQYDQPITEQLREVLRRVAVLGREALRGGPRSPELISLIEQCMLAFYGPSWARLPDWPSSLEMSRAQRGAPGEAPHDDDRGLWMTEALGLGATCLCILHRELGRGAVEIPIDPVAWSNTLAALEWTACELAAGRAQIGRPVMWEDVERIRRLRALGSEALAGGERPPELLSLTERCLLALYGPSWQHDLGAPGHGFPPLYLQSGNEILGTNQHSSSVDS